MYSAMIDTKQSLISRQELNSLLTEIILVVILKVPFLPHPPLANNQPLCPGISFIKAFLDNEQDAASNDSAFPGN